jgi:ABC-type uncharacterized transport system permease subunit
MGGKYNSGLYGIGWIALSITYLAAESNQGSFGSYLFALLQWL